MSKTHDLFVAAHSAIKSQIEFKTEWNNGTGYLDALQKLDLTDKWVTGSVIKTVTDDARRVIIIVMGKVFRNVVLFERYEHGQDGIIVHNSPTCVYQLFAMHSNVTEAQLALMLGDLYWINDTTQTSNVGKRMADFAKRVARLEEKCAEEDTEEQQPA